MGISLLNFFQENPLKKMRTIIVDNIDKVIAVNKNYIISKTRGQLLKIECFETKIFDTIKYNTYWFKIKFHPQFENTFLLVDDDIAKLYKIVPDTCKCEEIVVIQAHKKGIYLAEFSKTDENIFATYSIDNTIKIWNIEYPFCICNIPLNHVIDKIQIYNNFIFYYDIYEGSIIKHDYKTFEIIEKYESDTKKYNTLNF